MSAYQYRPEFRRAPALVLETLATHRGNRRRAATALGLSLHRFLELLERMRRARINVPARSAYTQMEHIAPIVDRVMDQITEDRKDAA